MYSLIMGNTDGWLEKSRVLEYTDEPAKKYIAPRGEINISRLAALPALAMPELHDENSPQVAHIGHVESLKESGRKYLFRFVPSPYFHPIPSEQVEARALDLNIDSDGWEFRRTHWAVKGADLFHALGPLLIPSLQPTVFRFPTDELCEDSVSVMMPFGKEFEAVYETLRGAAEDNDLPCVRADEIWHESAIINDIARLIYKSRVVVADLTGRNANVFYEAGIAHTLGREVVLVTQNPNDVPFDLRHLRYIHYLANDQGLKKLREDLSRRLHALFNNS